MKEMTPQEKQLVEKISKQYQQEIEHYQSTSSKEKIEQAYIAGKLRAYQFAINEIYEYLQEVSK